MPETRPPPLPETRPPPLPGIPTPVSISDPALPHCGLWAAPSQTASYGQPHMAMDIVMVVVMVIVMVIVVVASMANDYG